MSSAPPKNVKGYELVDRLGAGGFGEVYRAYQPVLKREVAIKVILPEFANEPEFIRRFEAEAQLVARLEHPHIVPLYDYWREPDSAFLVMRWIRGGSLRESLSHPWEITPALQMIDQISGALYAAHRRGVVHRDIKPENILVDEDGNAYLTDFGIARIIGRDYADLEEDDEVSGSLHYMAPEQLRGLSILQPQTDLYALGLVVYELLTGQYVFPEASITEVIFKNGNEPIPDIRRLKPEYPQALNEALQKATDKNLEARFKDTLEFAQALRQAFQTTAGTTNVRTTAAPAFDEVHLINPYKGLRPFEEADSDDFFGREALTWQLLERLREQTPLVRFLAVAGPSGSGKSSVVKAGLLPALRKDELKGSSTWLIRTMEPGNQPLKALEETLVSVAQKSTQDLQTVLKGDSSGLLKALDQVLGEGSTELLLVIDQFEEFFTFTTDESERAHFLSLLYTAVTAPESRLRVIVMMRADYYDRPLLYDEFGTLVKNRTEFVLPLLASELERAITGPALRVGLQVGSDVVAAIVDDIRHEPGGLPLLQYALTELYERREGRQLTLDAYYESGGVTGALARRAEQVYSRLRPGPQAITRQIFLRLVNPDDTHQDSHRQTRRSELLALGDADTVNDVLDTFDNFRLLTFDREPGTREPMVEIAHEALIRSWERLWNWLDESRDDLRLQRRFSVFYAEWVNAGRKYDFLLQGGRLMEFEAWAKNTELTLTPDEHAYIATSVQERENLRTIERERKERETRLERYSQWVVRALLAAVIVAVIGAVILIAQIQIAARNAALSRSLGLADGARYESGTGNVDLALALALQSNAIDQPPVQAQNALFEAAYEPGTRRVFGAEHAAGVRIAVFSPDGLTILSGGCAVEEASGNCTTGELILRDAEKGTVLNRSEIGTSLIRALAIQPEGTQALIASGKDVIVWDLATWSAISTLTGHTDEVRTVAWSPDGTQALSGASDNTLILWNLTDSRPLHTLTGHRGRVRAVVFSPNGTQALSGAVDGNLILWDLTAGAAIRTFATAHSGAITTVAFNQDRTRAVSGSDDRLIILWDVATGEPLRRFEGHTDGVTGVIFANVQGTALLSASLDRSLIKWDIASGQPLFRLRGHSSTIWSLALSADHRRALTASADDTLRVWNITNGAEIQVLRGHTDVVNNVAISSDGQLVFSASDDGQIIQWDTRSGESLSTLARTEVTGAPIPALSLAIDAGNHAITGYKDGQVILWDLTIGAEIARFTDAHTQGVYSVAISPDGHLALSGADDGTLVAWDLTRSDEGEQAALQRTQINPLAAINSIDLSADQQTALIGLSDGRVMPWNLRSGELNSAGQFDDSVRNVAFQPGDATFLAQMQDGSLVRWDIANQKALEGYFNRYSTERSQRGWGVAVSPDGSTALSSASGNQLALWRLATGELIYSYQGHTDGIMSVAFDAAGDRAVSGALDDSVIVWRIARSTDELRTWITENRYIRDLTAVERLSYGIR